MKKSEVLNRINPLSFKGIAHRGLFNDKDIPENSIAAIKKAIEYKVAVEIDVHLTKDKKLVVIHDEELKRVTGKDGIVEHLTLEELNDYHLSNGESIPTLEEVLELINEQIPIFLELKVYEKNGKELATYVKPMLREKIKDKRNIILISFDPRSLWPFKKEGYIRSLLVCLEHKWTYIMRRTVESVDLEKVLFEKKKYQRYVKRHFVNAWTFESVEEIDKIRPFVDTVTYQFIEPEKVEKALSDKR